MDATIATLIGVGVGAFVTLLTQILISRREKHQLELQRAYEKEKWLRDKVQEIYANCFYYEMEPHYYIDDKIRDLSPIEYTKLTAERAQFSDAHWRERQKWLNLLTVYHPFQKSEEYVKFCEMVRERKVSRSYLVDLAQRDPRLRDMSNPIVQLIEEGFLKDIKEA